MIFVLPHRAGLAGRQGVPMDMSVKEPPSLSRVLAREPLRKAVDAHFTKA